MSRTLHAPAGDLGQIQELILEKERELKDAHDFQIRNLEVKLMQRSKDLSVTMDQLKQAKAAFHKLREDFAYNLQLIESRDLELAAFEKQVEELKGSVKEQSGVIANLQAQITEENVKWRESKEKIAAQESAIEQAKQMGAKEVNDTKIALEAQIQSLTMQAEVKEQANQMRIKSLEDQLKSTEEDCQRRIDEVEAEASKITPSILYDEHVTQLQMQLKEANLISQQLQRRLQTSAWELQEEQERSEMAASEARIKLREVEKARDETLEEHEAKMSQLMDSLHEVENNFVEQRKQFEIALDTQATRLKEEHEKTLQEALKAEASRVRGEAKAQFGYDIADRDATHAAKTAELRAELQEAEVKIKQQEHLQQLAQQNFEATLALRDARIQGVNEELERMREDLSAAAEVERRLRLELQSRSDADLEHESKWKQKISEATAKAENEKNRLQQEVSITKREANEARQRYREMKTEVESLHNLNQSLTSRTNKAVEEQQSLVETSTRQLRRDLGLRENEVIELKKQLAEAEAQARAARLDAERVRALTDERDSAVADLTRQLARANTELLVERQRRLRHPAPVSPVEEAVGTFSRNKRRAQLTVLTQKGVAIGSPRSSGSPDAPNRTSKQSVAKPAAATSPLFSGDYGPVDESLGLHLSDDTLALPSPTKPDNKQSHESTDDDEADFEYSANPTPSHHTDSQHDARARLSQSLQSLRHHVKAASKEHQRAADAAQAGAAAAAGPSSTLYKDPSIVAENESLRATVSMMKDEMLRMKEELMASPSLQRSKRAPSTSESAALRNEIERLQNERSALLENGKMLKSALRKAQSGSPGVSLLDATTEYSAQLAAVKKNFESLKRGLAQAQSEAPPLPKPSHQSVRGQFHSSGGQPSTRRSQSVPMKPLTTSNAPFARNATQNKQQYDRERFARTVSQRATTSQVKALEKIRQQNAARNRPPSRVPRNYNLLRGD